MSQVLESRQTRGDAIRRYATWQFGQHFEVDDSVQAGDEGSIPGSRLADAYLPKRKFRQKVFIESAPVSEFSFIMFQHGFPSLFAGVTFLINLKPRIPMF